MFIFLIYLFLSVLNGVLVIASIVNNNYAIVVAANGIACGFCGALALLSWGDR